MRLRNIRLSIQLNKLTGLVLLCLAFFSSGLVAQENKFSLSSYGNELSSEPNKFFYFNELDGVLFLDGNIKEGMYTNFRQAITENKIHTIVLNSMGGDVQEGLNIAGTVFDKGIKTYIPSGNECYSACSFIFFAGSEKYALGKLGVHQAAYADEISKEKIAVGVIKTISQISTADILLRLGEFNTPRFVEQRMLRTAPEDMYIFNKKELNKLGNLEISDNDKIFYEKIDNFINALQLHYAELDCENDATKCSPAQLCSRAASNKSWMTTTKAAKYVKVAKEKELSCGVPIPVCPEDIKKCTKEYLCTYGTTGLDSNLSWLNNSFANEAKLRGYSCGIKSQPYTEKTGNMTNLLKDLQRNLVLGGCEIGRVDGIIGPKTQDALYQIALQLDINYSDELSYNFSYLQFVFSKIKNLKHSTYKCKDNLYRFGCSYLNPKDCNMEALCELGFTKNGWIKKSHYNMLIRRAKYLGLTCEKREETDQSKYCTSLTPQLCSNNEICQITTKNNQWSTNLSKRVYLFEAVKRNLSCGLIGRSLTHYQLICEEFTSDIESKRKIQTALAKLGHYDGQINGVCDPKTVNGLYSYGEKKYSSLKMDLRGWGWQIISSLEEDSNK
jgi:hypothetical protein